MAMLNNQRVTKKDLDFRSLADWVTSNKRD